MAGKEGENGEAEKTAADVFGVERHTKTGEQVVPPAPAKEEKKPEGEGEGQGQGNGGGKAEDLEQNPVVKGLRDEITKLETNLAKETGDKASMGQNLSKMRERLEKLEKGEKGAAVTEPLFKDIKRVKDLPKEDQEAMTETEKKLFDESADLKEKMNGIVAASVEKETEAKSAAEKAQEAKDATEAFNQRAQGVALKLSGSDQKMANAILSEFNTFAGNDKLDDTALLERMQKAAKLVPDYKPQKEQPNKPAGGSTAVKTNEEKDDAFGNSAIVDTVIKGKRGGYQL